MAVGNDVWVWSRELERNIQLFLQLTDLEPKDSQPMSQFPVRRLLLLLELNDKFNDVAVSRELFASTASNHTCVLYQPKIREGNGWQ